MRMPWSRENLDDFGKPTRGNIICLRCSGARFFFSDDHGWYNRRLSAPSFGLEDIPKRYD